MITTNRFLAAIVVMLCLIFVVLLVIFVPTAYVAWVYFRATISLTGNA